MAGISNLKGGGGGKAPQRPEKQVRFSLSKEQKLYVEELVRLDNRIAVCREYIELWMQFFRFFAEDLREKEIQPAEEKAFFQVMSQLARKHFLFVELMANKFERGNDIMGVLAMAVSLAHIQNMPENTLGKLELDWHSLFLDMNKTLGRLVRQMPGNMTLAEALESLKDVAVIGARPVAGAAASTAKVAAPLKNKLVAALLAFPPLGCVGAHMFYLGRPKPGVLRLVTLGGLGLWALVDFAMTLAGRMTDGEGRQLG